MADYWTDTNLKLYFTSKADHSIDNTGAKTYNKKATVPGTYVTDLQTDLIATGYLSGKADGDFGPKTKRAVLRFQRRALTSYRMSAGKAADVSTITYRGLVNGICDYATATELRLWIKSSLKAPLGRFSMVAISGGKLRNDAATKWTSAVNSIKAAGGTISSPYGDTTRGVGFRKSTGGNSLYSLHYTGRAVDLNQSLAGGKKQRYYVIKDSVGSDIYWTVLCKTTSQTGSQGVKYTKTKLVTKKYYSFWAKKEVDLPNGYYLDITAALKAKGFVRIKAHSDWKTNPKGTEWWHFHYDKDMQETFQDEMELIGHDEKTLRANGWNTEAKLDRKPG